MPCIQHTSSTTAVSVHCLTCKPSLLASACLRLAVFPGCQVLQEMLDMLRDHQNNWHASRLEWIIIWLLVIDVVLMLFQMLGIFGIVRNGPIRR